MSSYGGSIPKVVVKVDPKRGSMEESKDDFPSVSTPLKTPNSGMFDSPQYVPSSDLKSPMGLFRSPDVSSMCSMSSISLAPDLQLDGMTLVLQKELPKISVDRYYQTFWYEEPNSFYESWLKADGKTNITVGPWRQVPGDEEEEIVNPYDQETYDQIRTVTYSYHRSTSVYSGPVTVAMTQYCRRIRRSRCVVSSTVKFSGMPYYNAFQVHVRWVASRRQKVNLKIQVGLCVVMLEQVLVASQIKANTMNEMTESAKNLYRAMKKALGFTQVNFDSKMLQKQFHPMTHWLKLLFPFAAPSTKNDAHIKVREAQFKLARVRALPKKEDDLQQEEQKQHIIDEMDAVHDALDAILLRKYAGAKTTDALSGHTKSKSIGDGVMRSLSPRKVRVRDPSMFHKKEGSDQIDLQRRDKTLGKMEVIVSSTIPDVSLDDFANVFLTNEQGQNGFYADWLRETDRENVKISTWESEDQLQSLLVDDFSGESFTLRRLVNCTFNKAKFLRDGSPSVESKQTQEQFYRMDEDKRLVFASTSTVENVPFANSFQVHIRWVVTQLRTKELSVKVGLFVVFKKQALLEPKIRAGATKEGRRTQLDLFLKVRAALGKVYEERTMAQQKALEEYLTPTPWICDILPSPLKFCTPLAQSNFVESDETLYEEFENAKLKLRATVLFLQESEVMGDLEAMKFMLGELNVVNDALDNIAEWHGDRGGAHTLGEASFQ